MTSVTKKILKATVLNPFLWLRYLHSMFCIWPDDIEKIYDFFKCLNIFSYNNEIYDELFV